MNDATLTQEELTRALREIFKRSQTDLEFRTLCLSDPNEALRLVTGKAVPPDINIRFAEPSEDSAKPPDAAT
jgi:hypothetical protein